MVITIPTINLEKILYDKLVQTGRDPTKYTNESVRDRMVAELDKLKSVLEPEKEQPK